MHSLIIKAIASTNIVVLTASSATAQYWGGGGRGWGSGGWGSGGWGSGGWGSGSWGSGGWGSGGWGSGSWGSGSGGSGSGGALVAPEIDASSGMLAIVALSAVLLFVFERRRQAKAIAVEASE